MPKTSIYLQPGLDRAVKALGLNVSAVCQEALRVAVEEQTRVCDRCGQRLPTSAEGAS